MQKIAILYQAKLPPIKDGVQKPMKSGGYSDSGADIAYELKKNGVQIVTPTDNPNINIDLDWVFPDTKKGIQAALDRGANTLWLNTVLFKNHPIEHFFDLDIQCIGQLPSQVDVYDDKYVTNELLRKHHIPIPKTTLISIENLKDYSLDMDFPLVIKPIRGRGSQGVSRIENQQKLNDILNVFFSNKEYGNMAYVEQFLSGQEITITVMPPGNYMIDNEERVYKKPWCLPAVKRFNHENGIAPYSGITSVIKNSSVLENDELNSEKMNAVYKYCEKAGKLLNIKAPIRIDCRADEHGDYFLFDVNLKPNMTGPSRPHRQEQDSLTLLASKKIGWNYIDLLTNILKQSWKVSC